MGQRIFSSSCLLVAAVLTVAGCGEDSGGGGGGSSTGGSASGGGGSGGAAGGGGSTGGGGEGGAPTVDPLPEVICTHFVDGTSGSDQNAGSSETSAWLTIQHAADTLEPGQTVCILEGTYVEHVVVERSGAAEAWLTFAAHPGHDVLLDGTTLDVGSDGIFEVKDASYVRVTGLRVEQSSWAAILARRCEHLIIDHNSTFETRSSGVGVWRSDDVRVEANEIRRARNSSDGAQEWLTMGSGTHFVIRGNVIHDGLDPDYPYVLGIDAKHSQYGLIEQNHIYEVLGSAIYIDGWDEHTHHIVVRDNYLHDVTRGVSIGSEQGGLVDEIDIYNNIVVRAGNSGIQLTPVSLDGPRERIRIFNNTIVESVNHGGGGIYVHTTNVDEIIIRNNLVAFGPQWQGMIRADSPAGITADHNLIFGESKFPEEELGGSIQADPLFADIASSEATGFAVQAGSPAIDSGSEDGAPGYDFAGVARPQDGDGNGSPVVDIGAFERPE